MELIRKSNWSCAYRDGDEFVKQLNFWVPEAAEREAKASDTAYGYGILTPKYISTEIVPDVSLCLRYEYLPIKKLSNEDVLSDSKLLSQVIELLDKLSEIKWDNSDTYWDSFLVKEFDYEFSFLNFNTQKYSDFIHSLKPSVFIHGDCSIYNMGLLDNHLVIFDFQHGSLGPEGWDKAYFMATINRNAISNYCLKKKKKRMAEIISAIRLGRAIKKNLKETPIRREIYESWKSI